MRVSSKKNSNSPYTTPVIGTSTDTLVDIPLGTLTGLQVTTNDKFTVTFTWDTALSTAVDTGNLAITEYRLERITPTPVTTLTPGGVTSSLSITMTGSTSITYATSYTLRISAVNTCGVSDPSTTMSISFTTKSAPSAPLVANAPTLVDMSGTQIQFSWTQIPTDEDSTGGYAVTAYQLQAAKTSESTWTTIAQVDDVAYTQTSGWAWNTQYRYIIRAVNQLGAGVASSNLTLTTPTVPIQMSAPQYVSLNCTHLVVQWSAFSNIADQGRIPITTYNLRFKLASSPSAWVTASLGSSFLDTTFTLEVSELTALSSTPFTAFDFQVAASNQAGTGTWSNTLRIHSPNTPTKPSAAPTIDTTNDVTPENVYITWTAPADTIANNGNCSLSGYVLEWAGTNLVYSALTSCSNTDLTYNQTSGFSTGTQYNYRFRACNAFGQGTASDAVTITTDKVPQAMSTVTVSVVNPTNITITWPALTAAAQTGGDDIIYYQCEYANSTTGNPTWIVINPDNTLTTSCTHDNGAVVFTQTYIYYRVKPQNNVGFGTTYGTVTATTDRVPSGMGALTTVEVNPQNIAISWSALTSTSLNGGDEPSFYSVEWSPNNSNWYTLNSGDTELYLSYNYTVNFIFNTTTQYFRVKPKNGVGWGTAYSATLSVTSDTKPTGMNTPTQVSVDPTFIVISWTALTDSRNGGDTPISYQVEYLNSNGNNYDLYINNQNYYSWTVLNPGETDLEFSYNHTLTSGTFLSGSKQYYRIRAQNRVGMSAYVSSALTCIADAIPTGMNTPTIANSQTDITPTSITISWAALTDSRNGGDVPSFYQVEWFNQPTGGYLYSNVNNQGNYAAYWTVLISSGSLALSYTHTPGTIFPAGSKVWYRVRPRNGVGLSSAVSTVLEVTADTIPAAMNTPTATLIKPYNITISWAELTSTASNGGDLPIFYQVEYYTNQTGSWQILNTYGTDPMVLTYMHSKGGGLFLPTYTHYYRIKPRNGVGWGSSYSASLTVVPNMWPTCMNTISSTGVTPYTITLTWSELTSTSCNGGDIPYYYQVEWYNSGAWTVISTESQGKYLTFTHDRTSSGLTFPSGSIQQYRVLPKNEVGWGSAYSNTLSVTADQTPTTMNTPTQVSVEPTKIIVKWDEITSDTDIGWDTVTFYSLEWDQGLGPSTPANWVALNTADETTKITQYEHVNNALFPSGIDVYYRVRPKNGVGYGVYSSTLKVTTDSVPLRMNEPTVYSVDPAQIIVNWTSITADADTGRDDVIYYKLEYRGISDDPWIILNPNEGELINSFVHEESPHFTSAVQVEFRVCAKNGVGMGACSEVLQVLTDEEPTFMNVPLVPAADVHPTWIYITWESITDEDQKGRDAIIFYDLQWDSEGTAGTPEEMWVSLIDEGAGVLNAFNHTKPDNELFLGNSDIHYRLRAKNGVGYGVYSDLTVTKTDDVPQFMNPPTLVSCDYNNITLTWDPIFGDDETGRDPVTYYQLIFFDMPCFADDDSPCYGQEPTPIELTSPTVQYVNTTFSHTTATHFSKYRDFQYRVCAWNGMGEGACSEWFTITTDNVPDAPTLDPANATVIYNQVSLVFATILDTETSISGASPVISYEFQWDNYLFQDFLDNSSLADLPWVSLPIIAQDDTKTELTLEHQVAGHFEANRKIYYRMRAINNVGAGSWSSEIEVQTADVPNKMSQPVIDTIAGITATQITISWTELPIADNGGDLVIYYRLEWDEGDSSKTLEEEWTELTNPSLAPTISTSFLQSSGGSPFSNNTDFRYRLRAKNGVGFGNYSDHITVTSDRTPLIMQSPTSGTVLPKSIVIDWVALEEENNGRDPLVNYKLEYNAGSTWEQILETDVSTFTYTYTIAQVFPYNSNRDDYTEQVRIIIVLIILGNTG